jgi:hypothetical protein
LKGTKRTEETKEEAVETAEVPGRVMGSGPAAAGRGVNESGVARFWGLGGVGIFLKMRLNGFLHGWFDGKGLVINGFWVVKNIFKKVAKIPPGELQTRGGMI